MKIILTCATEKLGSPILFRLLTKSPLEVSKMYPLVRSKNRRSPRQRILAMLKSDFTPHDIVNNLESVLKRIAVIDTELLFCPSRFFLKKREVSLHTLRRICKSFYG